ncbi:hypothetical protein [Sulfurimonas sp.]|uniref:hypothetical protein n=1 Tax=Sulfurimonas sp. TaxID=2022749 RepID=UPI0025CE19B8|nr:hypothetical protein [Sulfurimonas sp.]
MKQTKILILLLLLPCFLFSQEKEKYDWHKTIIEFDYGFGIHQSAKDYHSTTESSANVYKENNFINFRYTNAFFVKSDLSLGLSLGFEIAPVIEIPLTLDIRKYFGTNKNRNYLSLNLGKAFYKSAEFNTWLGELGFGRNFKLGKKSSLNTSFSYQLTYLKEGSVKVSEDDRSWVKDFYMHSLSFRLGIMF